MKHNKYNDEEYLPDPEELDEWLDETEPMTIEEFLDEFQINPEE